MRLQAALDLLIRLNDRFALDGGAPPSYGGLLWCLGWRDRPGGDGCPTTRPTSSLRFPQGALERRTQARCGNQLTGLLASAAADGSAASTPSADDQPSPTAGDNGLQSEKKSNPSAAEDDSRQDERTAKRARNQPTGQQSLWHFLNRESTAALPPSGSQRKANDVPD